MSESRKISENAFIGNPDYSVLLLEGKTIYVFLGGQFPVRNVAACTCTRCVCQHKQVVCSIILGLISLLTDVRKYWFLPSI